MGLALPYPVWADYKCQIVSLKRALADIAIYTSVPKILKLKKAEGRASFQPIKIMGHYLGNGSYLQYWIMSDLECDTEEVHCSFEGRVWTMVLKKHSFKTDEVVGPVVGGDKFLSIKDNGEAGFKMEDNDHLVLVSCKLD